MGFGRCVEGGADGADFGHSALEDVGEGCVEEREDCVVWDWVGWVEAVGGFEVEAWEVVLFEK